MTKTRKLHFPVGTMVRDKKTGETGEVVYLYEDKNLRHEIVAVRFDGLDDAVLAVPIDTLEWLP
jgi:hypothetical protein